MSQWVYYHVGAPFYDAVLGAFTLGHWWRWQRAVLDGMGESDPILDLGCGTGRLLAQRLRVGPVAGVDMSLPMLRQAKRRLASRAAPILQADAACLPFADDTFGGAITTGLFTAMKDIRPVLDEIERVVRPGGKLAFVETMPPENHTVGSRIMTAMLSAVRDNFHDIPGMLSSRGMTTDVETLGRFGTVHLITATVG